MNTIKPLHISTPDCQPQGVFQIKGMQAQHAIRSMLRPHWIDNFMYSKSVCFLNFHILVIPVRANCTETGVLRMYLFVLKDFMSMAPR